MTEVSDGLEAVQKAKELQPSLILLDIGLPNLNGIEVARRVREFAPNARIIFLSQESSPDVVREALSLGASGYVHKSRLRTDLRPAIEAVVEDRQFVNRSLKFARGAALERPINYPARWRHLQFLNLLPTRTEWFGFLISLGISPVALRTVWQRIPQGEKHITPIPTWRYKWP